MKSACKLHPINDDEWNRLELEDRTDIEKRINETERILAAQRTGTSLQRTSDITKVSLINRNNMERVSNIAGGVSIRDTHIGALRSFLVREMGVVSDFVTGNYTGAGWVRESINRVERASKGGIDKAIRDLGLQEFVNTNYTRLNDELKKLNINRKDRSYILSETTRLGFIPWLEKTEMLRPAGRAYLRSELDKLVFDMGEKWKIPSHVIDDIITTGQNTGHLYNRLTLAVQEAGIKAEMWDLLPRQLTDAALQRVNWKYGTNNAIVFNNGDVTDAEEIFLKSSTTNAFVVEDEVLMDLVIRRIGLETADDPRYLYRKALPDIPDAGIADVLDSRHSMLPIMQEILERGYPDVVESLIDSQLISKIPLSNAEVFENMQRMMKTPFRDLDEVFVTDWRLGMKAYRQKLEFAAKRSGFVNALVTETANGNWGVTALERSTDSRYANFVPLRQAIDQRVLRGTMMNQNPALDTLYIHPFAAAMARAHQEIQMSPYALSIFARTVSLINRGWSRMTLLTPEYLPRQVVQGMVSVGLSGSNMLGYPINVYKVLSVQLAEAFGRKTPKMFDNTLAKYRTRSGEALTEQGLYNYLQDIGLGSKGDIQLGDDMSISLRPINPERNARYIADVLMQQGIGAGVREGVRTLDEYTRMLGIPGMVMNNVVNNAGLMTVVQSSMKSTKRNPISYTLSNVINPNRFDYVEDAVEYAKQFFYYYDDTTRANEFLRKYVVPFWGFTSRNVPAMIRYTYNHPSRFMAIQRMYALANSPVQDDEWLSEGTVADWMLQGRTWYWKVPGGRSDGRDAYYAIDLATIDPLGSALAEVEGWAAMLGIQVRPKSTSARLDAENESNPIMKLMIRASQEQSLMPVLNLVLSIGGDMAKPPYARELDNDTEVAGVVMSRTTRLLLETLFPPVRTLERFTTDRYDREQYNPYSGLSFAGIRVYPVDVYANLGFTFEQLDYVKRDLRRLANSSPTEEGRRHYESLLEQVEMDSIKLEQFARREGVDLQTAYESLRERRIKIGELKNDGSLP